ncbi:OCIA domain-containing protein 1-like [Vanessa tameamea]|uniref:OCIA domain-containing protein 1-like n=1 Tax=Vanessa tameamea TaxID=334116 RepID=A0A8B8IU17_VANTA|nr:OCIA domain-containing protein 1-like [Vanessa tameamea]XP_047543576.1 OCIA domain-containing protein 1-like [Vanessa atalanta]
MVDNDKNKKQEECNDEAQAKWSCPPIRNVTHPLRYYEFTQEEIKALEECDKESFYQRCLPFSSVFAAITYAGVKNGILRRNPHFGAAPKVMFAAFIGYSFGRLSYISECDLKLRHLPADSNLGKIMRQYYLQNNPAKNSK